MSDSDRYTTNTFKPSAQSDEIPSWGCVAITLDPKGKRYQTFLENNNHLQVDTFYGIKGAHLSKEEIISQGLATEDLLASGLTNSGTIGCAASQSIQTAFFKASALPDSVLSKYSERGIQTRSGS